MFYKLYRTRIFAPFFLLAGCVPGASEYPPEPTVSGRPVVARPPAIIGVGLENVIGANARSLAAQFGAPDLDVREGTARKLQYSGPTCVLDTYLYPRTGGGEAVVTYIDARFPDGRAMDRASCVAALRAQRQAR
jgi:hypothetical protein